MIPVTMDYFYAPPEKRQGATILIDGEEFSHLSHVLRKAPGNRLTVVDGCGMAYAVTIREIVHHTAYCEIAGTHPRLHESEADITLGVGILKHSAQIDLLVEKTTELGVTRIVPLLTSRTIPRHAREERWRKVALAAMKQCGRCVLPAILPITGFADFLQMFSPTTIKCIPHEKISRPVLAEVIAAGTSKEIALAIGPEGGFTEEEVAAAVLAGFQVVSLGPRRLRTETAAIGAVWAVTEWGK